MPGIDHYRDLLHEQQWLQADGLCWTVVQAGDDADLVRRLSPGALPEVRDLDVREDPANLAPLPVVFTDGDALVETMGSAYLDEPEVLARLSRDARVWSVSWGPRSGVQVTQAADGAVIRRWREFDENAAPAADFSALDDARRADDRFTVRAAAMAAVDAATGARLDAAWFEDTRRAFILDHPSPAAPPLLPPFAHTDPERDTFLRSLPLDVRRAVLATVAGRMPTGLDDDSAQLDALYDLCGEWQESGEAQQLHAGLAIRAAARAAEGDATNFDALASARSALDTARWAALDAEIRALTGR
ncbi:hypothetical protein [Nonomuraea endophytica]|uniref:Uncharacterized protein n=1 Tax=Nonomuraea endophytica TaxID=714136 RepID=A0A7W8A0Z6_9ACTN|nr:hypothetical protein [Nonomuraea endophytica]MBB5077507.1 hypothetical protein [Nonomuraea endophytica]